MPEARVIAPHLPTQRCDPPQCCLAVSRTDYDRARSRRPGCVAASVAGCSSGTELGHAISDATPTHRGGAVAQRTRVLPSTACLAIAAHHRVSPIDARLASVKWWVGTLPPITREILQNFGPITIVADKWLAARADLKSRSMRRSRTISRNGTGEFRTAATTGANC